MLQGTTFSPALAKDLADATERCWQAILAKDVVGFGRSMREAFEAQITMFPHTMNDRIAALIDEYRDQALGWKLSGAGGGGYLILVSDKPVANATRILARREAE